MTEFAFIVHPLTPKDAARKYPVAKLFPDSWIEKFLTWKKPVVVSEITGVQSITGAETRGWFIGCPLTPELMTKKLDLEFVYQRIAECARLAADEGAKLIGLGAFTSVVGDGGISVARQSPIPVTTGNSYTVATAIDGSLDACKLVGIEPEKSVLAVVGATGSIGRTCATLLAPQFLETVVIGRDTARTAELAAELPRAHASTDIRELNRADCVVTVTSSESSIIEPEHLKPGSVVCDVARPRDVSVRVQEKRHDVLVIEGGVVLVPGRPNFHFNFGFPPGRAYACMAETMMLALDNRPEPFTLGKDVTVEQVEETRSLAAKHGFKLDGFRSFEKVVSSNMIEHVREARSHTPTSAYAS